MRGAGKPIWDDIASDTDLAALSPRPPGRIPVRPDVLVVGGGVIGLAIAAFCTRAGMDVLLVEREPRLALHASGRAAGGLSPDAHPAYGESWVALGHRSLELHRELNDEWDTGLRPADLLVMPDLLIPGQAHVDPLRFCAALARRAGTILTKTSDEQLADVRASHTVFATGHAPGEQADRSFVKGHLIATEPVDPVIDGIVAFPHDDVIALQLASGQIVCGGTKEPGIDAADLDEAVCGRIGDVLTGVCATARVTHRWTCFRPLIPGELPLVERVDERTWHAGGFYSTGVLMAPVIGEIVANAIANDETPDGLFG
jgi:glycine/D-amino acid oxidase-like deaminating enzyme